MFCSVSLLTDYFPLDGTEDAIDKDKLLTYYVSIAKQSKQWAIESILWLWDDDDAALHGTLFGTVEIESLVNLVFVC